ncbi:putative ubiquitin-conjugating enzyme E2 24 [Morus notabilis]|uniref:E2 ubiquitin-conjugating enzyme n=1 Tax=Morus notabilis TaxID=981085 RepID=W9RYU3_9ROSA|nr:probable ubiquitin-conjugating enzyme E2 24 [Morus notabilis]XP_024029110.1 probable ubiquitin-conjugating enzyme E2 24 [Morus notabilis]XP_024029111.1 probable ubiquitin-conjugating enzyme E2 24 [Morus notabilis]EXC18111.1 putative ubiquitin-conjugating enzyme E2 24 [Morus notabilis]
MDLLLSDSDWDSSSESGMEDQEEVDFLYGGQAQSLLSSLEQSIEKIDDFLSFERGFMHGDMVFSVTDPSGQMGRVVGIELLVDLENVHGKIIKDINSKNLSKIRSFSVGDYVVCGPWIGKVEKVVDLVTVVFDDGTKYEVNAMDQDKLVPISPNILEDAQYPYYPGQRVKVKLSTVSKSAKWLCGTWKKNQEEGTVCAVEAGLVYVDWLASILTVSNLNLPSPPRMLESKKLTLLSCFLHANWQLGDWCVLQVSGHMGVMEQKFERGVRGRNLGSNFDAIFVIVKTKIKVDVVWQNGSISLGLDSQTLLPASAVNSYEFWPEQFVLEKGTCDDPHVPSGQRWGVVLGMDAKERTVKVQWKTNTTAEMKDMDGKHMVETVSAYELVEHPDYCYCFGDLVFRPVRNQFDDQADNNTEAMAEERAVEGYGSDENKFPQKCYLSCIGNVIGFKHGAVEVKWASGIISKVAPYEIYRVDKHDHTVPVDVEGLNEEMTELDKQTSMDKGLLNSDSVGDGCKKHLWESTSFFLPQAAIGFLTSIASSLLGTSGSTSRSGSTPLVHIPEVGSESGIPKEKEVLEGSDLCNEPQIIDELDTFVKKILNQEAKQLPENKDLQQSTYSNNPDKFRQFDMAADCSDHNFISAGKGFALSQVKRSWVKKVQQEWSILEKELPETIYVRIFEERMDLIRAAIVGTPGTPYHDGLFFFDIYLPPEYPHEPPMVHYISGGLRVNPNLYESGKVCLSLLNTWAGTDTEVWNPGSSSILQVLLSLQALVLNEKPYFNEAGYDQQMGKAEGEKNSVSYNENAFLMTCKSMLYLLRKPPKHFEALVEEHFSLRSQHILMACKAYMEGASVGCAVGCGKTENDHQRGSSTGFKIMLSKLFPKLVEAFFDKGIDCSQLAVPEKQTG